MIGKKNSETSYDKITPEEYSMLRPNIHTELVASLINTDLENKNGIGIYKTDWANSNELFTHNSFDIIYTVNSEAEITVRGDRLELSKHNILFISPGVPYQISSPEGAMIPVVTVPKEMIISHFHSLSTLEGMLPRFISNGMWGEVISSHMVFTKLPDPGIHTLFRLMVTEYNHNSTNAQFILSQLLLCIFGGLARQSASTYELSQGKITRSLQIGRILNFIQSNYRNVTLDMLAEHFHYTVPYVSKLVRSATGLTFTEILREIKFDVCRSLLLNSDLKINKIAEVAGFQNTDHFNRIFKKRMGETPTEYKKNKTGIDK